MKSIREWLAQIGLEHFADLFEKNGIDFELLREVTSEDLIEIGVERLADRKLLLREVVQLARDKAAALQERRLLTVLFCDLVGSTALSTEVDPEDFRSALRLYQDTTVRAITKFNGFIARFLGDGVLAYFGWPYAVEDQVAQAVRAGLETVESVKRLRFEGGVVPHCRVGIATGRVVVGGNADPDSAFGETPNLAARLQALAAEDQIVIDKVTRTIIGNGFDLTQLADANLKGFDAPVSVWIVAGERKDMDRFEARHSSAPHFAGRNAEMQVLLGHWRSVDASIGRNVVIHGEAGIGKSRLVNEFLARTADQNPRIVRLQCSPNHVNSAFHPVIRHLVNAAELGPGDEPPAVKLDKLAKMLARSSALEPGALETIADLLSIEHERRGPSRIDPKQQRQAAIGILADAVLRMSGDRPVLVVVEDAHWIDPSSRELLGKIVELTQRRAAMVLVTLRPTHKFLLDGDARFDEITLNRLTDEEIGAIAKSIVGSTRLASADVARIVSRADGVPLFVEEMTSSALDHEVHTRSFDLPDTLQASLTARLDLLGSAKELAQVGSVLGREFRHSELSILSGVPAPALDAALKTLLASGLLLEAEPVGEARYRFKHALVQDAAYESLLKADRRNLHRRVVQEVLSESAKAREPEVVAHHLTEAGQLREAIEFWKVAGMRAAAASANVEAIAQFQKGLDLLDRLPGDDQHDALEFGLHVGLTAPLIASSGYTSDALRECISKAMALSQRIAHTPEIYAILYSRWGFLLTTGHMAESHKVALDFSELSVQQHDQDAMYARHRMLGASCMCLGELGEATEHLDHAITQYDPAQHARLVASYGVDIRVAALCFKAEVLWLTGHADQARASAAQALADARKSKHLNSISMSMYFCGLVSFLCRDQAAVRTYMDELLELAAVQSIGAWPTLGRAMLGWARLVDGRAEEGQAMLAEGVAAAKQARVSMFMPFFLCRIAEAMLAANRLGEAQHQLDNAQALITRTGEVNYAGELYRLKAELHVRKAEFGPADVLFNKALHLARAQSAKAVELRVATTYAAFLARQREAERGLGLLEPLCEWFKEGLATPDLVEAQATLVHLRAVRMQPNDPVSSSP